MRGMRREGICVCLSTLMLSLLLQTSCSKEAASGGRLCQGGDTGLAPVAISLQDTSPGVKSILQDESADSGFQVMIFDHSDSSFIGCVTFPSRAGGDVMLRKDIIYDFYVIGNLWYLDRAGNRKTLEDAGIITAGGVRNLSYRFGGSEEGGLKPESFGDIETFGIPYSGYKENVSLSSDSPVTIEASYLFAKLNVTINHSNLVNGGVAADVFRNSRLYIRGANSIVKPFITGVAATSASDLLEISDYDAVMANASSDSETYTYYVPENAQGTSNVSAASLKTPSVKPFATYVEFTASLDGADISSGGYGGTLTYQFCPGADVTTDFNVIRNTLYDISLSFKAGSLFEPSWTVNGCDAPDWSDTRKLCFASKVAVSSASDLLKEDGTQVLAVRQNRPAVCYVYFNRSGDDASNERGTYLDYISSNPASYNPANVSRSGLFMDYSSATLAKYGMKLSYNQSTGEITISYDSSSPNRGNFLDVPVGGIPVTLTLYPGNAAGTGRSCTAFIKTYENLSFSRKESSDLYIGQKTVLEAKGFAGIPGVKASEGNVLRTTNVAGTDHYLGSDAVTMASAGPGAYSLDLYSYRNSTALTISALSTDNFNDAVTTETVTVYKPSFVLAPTEYDLAIDGTEVPVSVSYKDRMGNVMPESAFDAGVYAQLMKPVITKGAQTTSDFSYVSVDAATSCMYINDIPGSVTKPTSRTKMGTISVSGRDNSLYPVVTGTVYYRYPNLKASFSNINSNCINVGALPHLTDKATIDPAGCISCFSGCNDWYKVASGTDGTIKHQSCTLTSSGQLIWDWYLSEDDALLLTGNRNVALPYGKRTFDISVTNKHSGNKYSLPGVSFDISYNAAEIYRVVLFRLDDYYSYCYLCTAMSAFIFKKWIDAGMTKMEALEPPKVNGITPYMAYYQNDETYYHQGEVQYYFTNCRTSMSSRYAQWYLDNEMPLDPGMHGSSRPSDYTAKWSGSLVDNLMGRQIGYPFGVYFYYSGRFYEKMPQELYPREDNDLLFKSFPFHVHTEPGILGSDSSFYYWYICPYQDVR